MQGLLDLVNAFEKVPHEVLIAAAVQHGYCLTTLRLSIAAYRLPRSVGVEGKYSRIIVAVLGMTAGSGFATDELKLLFVTVVKDVQESSALIVMSIYVDDFNLEASHDSSYVAA